MLIGYARVSTNEQDTATQVAALKTVGCERIFREKASGGRWNRPELHRLLDQLRKETNKATYGPREVESAVDQGAVGRGGGVLIMSNRLFRSQDVAERKRWVSLVDRVRDVEGGEVRILSSDHESGRRLDGLGGIAALLTFPILEDDLDSEEDD